MIAMLKLLNVHKQFWKNNFHEQNENLPKNVTANKEHFNDYNKTIIILL